ncbi:hypothetical protein ACLBWT_18380 [Paenibacillus sp. D51F]
MNTGGLNDGLEGYHERTGIEARSCDDEKQRQNGRAEAREKIKKKRLPWQAASSHFCLCNQPQL